MKNKSKKVLLSLIAGLMIAAPPLKAADVPSRETAGAESSRFQEAPEFEDKARTLKARAPEEEEIVESPAGTSEGTKPALTFELKEIRVTGAQSIPASELEILGKGLLSKKVSWDDLQGLAARMKKYYREKGFVAVYVYIPKQEVEAGRVEFRVVEGEIGRIVILGNRWFSERVIRRALHFSSGKGVRYDWIKKSLNRLNKNSDIKAKAVLKPGKEFKTTDLEIHVKDRFPAHLNTDVNNLGTRDTGRTRWGIGAVHHNLSGQMDVLSGRFQIGRGAWAVGSDYNIPVSPWDTRLGFSYSHTRVKVGGQFKDLDVKGRASTYNPYLLQPLFDTGFLEGEFNLGMDFKSIENSVQGRKTGKDELRILNAGLAFEETDVYGKTFLPVSFHFGFADFLGSSAKAEPAASRAGTGGQFFVYRSSFIRYQRLPWGLGFALRGSWQLTPDPLPASEQFRLGGAFSVRGYPEGDSLTDYGGFLSSEVYIPSYFFPADWKLPHSSLPLRKQIQGVAFFDFGAGALHDPAADDVEDRFLAGAGGGVRIQLFDKVYARFQWAGRTGGKSSDGSNGAFYYGISAELF